MSSPSWLASTARQRPAAARSCCSAASRASEDQLFPSEHTTHSPPKGDAVYWHLRVGDRTIENAAWSYPEPPPGAPPLAGYIAFFIASMDSWLEEDEPMLGHVRDPYHRIDVLSTSRDVQVSLAGELVAHSPAARVLYETGLPPRWYFDPAEVKAELIRSDLRTRCSYKGYADYWSVHAGGELHENVAWTYHQPLRDGEPVAGRVAFFNERVDLVVDGEPQPRIQSPWSAPGWWHSLDEFMAQL